MSLPVNGSTHLIPAYYSFYRPRKDERLSWPNWLTCSGWFTHISGHPSAAGRAQDRESSPARDRRSTTVPRHQLSAILDSLYWTRIAATLEESVWVFIAALFGWSSCSNFDNVKVLIFYAFGLKILFTPPNWVKVEINLTATHEIYFLRDNSSIITATERHTPSYNCRKHCRKFIPAF